MFLPNVQTVFKMVSSYILLFKLHAQKNPFSDDFGRPFIKWSNYFKFKSLCDTYLFLSLFFILTNKKILIFKCDYFNQWEKSDLFMWAALASCAVTTLHSLLLAIDWSWLFQGSLLLGIRGENHECWGLR